MKHTQLKRLVASSLLFLATAGTAFAQVTVSDPWVRATVAAQKASGAFMTTAARDARLVERVPRWPGSSRSTRWRWSRT